MLLRMRWFLLGAASAFGAGAYVVARLRRLRQRLTPRNVWRASAETVADAIDALGRRLADDPAAAVGVDGVSAGMVADPD